MNQFNGHLSIIGRAISIHEKSDDVHSQPAGDIGKHIAGGIMEKDRLE